MPKNKQSKVRKEVLERGIRVDDDFVTMLQEEQGKPVILALQKVEKVVGDRIHVTCEDYPDTVWYKSDIRLFNVEDINTQDFNNEIEGTVILGVLLKVV